MAKIEAAGTYKFEVVDSGLSLTKNSFPQWVAKLKATEKFVDAPEEIAHFQKQGVLTDGQPGYVDWAPFGEETVAYLVLFRSATDFGKPSQLLNYEQLQVATGWEGTEFDSLTNGSFVGKSILGRVEEDTYNDKTTLRVNWIDKVDADPVRSLKSVDAGQIKNLSLLLKNSSGKATSKVAASAPAKAMVTKPISTFLPASTVSVSSVAVAATTIVAPASAPSAPKAPKASKKKEAPADPQVEAPAAHDAAGPPATCTKDEAWAYVVNHKGGNEDAMVTDAWISAFGEVGGDRDEDSLSPAEYAKIRDTVLKDLMV